MQNSRTVSYYKREITNMKPDLKRTKMHEKGLRQWLAGNV